MDAVRRLFHSVFGGKHEPGRPGGEPERRSGSDRRSGADRREHLGVPPIGEERRSGSERRTGSDRRT